MTSTQHLAANSASMADVLEKRAALSPEALAFCLLIDGEEGPQLTYAGLDRAARAVAAALQDVAEPGDRALLLYGPGLEFTTAFFGCQYAGVVPVPAYPPRPERLAQSWSLLSGIAGDCSPRVVLTGGAAAPFVSGISRHVPALEGARVVVTDGLDRGRLWRRPAVDSNALALLQYTSGSTGDPRGVMVTHRNLLHNETMIWEAFEHDRYVGTGVCWLPPYHDMGLIGGILQVIFHGASCLLLSPLALLQDPFRWLQAISSHRAATSGGPNFAYNHCVQRLTTEQRASLDLRSWDVAAIGSEPICPRALEEFTAAFEPSGFRPEAFYPCYGLAEATLFVTGGRRTAEPVIGHFSTADLQRGRACPVPPGPESQTLVGCGHAWLDQEVRIVDPESGIVCADRQVGEIWVQGPSVALGYWNRPEESRQTFHARRADTGTGPYLRTGDLGFLHQDELFVTGRIKELIVIRGRNHYPQDIEQTVQSVRPELRAGCGAAFEVLRDGQPRLVVVQEIDRRCRDLDLTRTGGDIRQAVAERHDLHLADVQFLESGTIPKTSSGKVRRQACRQGYESGSLRLWKARGRT
jgi:acyl-CoA synthetase (AMP-forming)/AMP-acid ligase II